MTALSMEASNSDRMAAFVMAAGRGERLAPLTHKVPKCLVEVGQVPVLDRWWRKLAETNIDDVFINTHHLPDRVRERVALYNKYPMPFWHIVHEPSLLGTGRTLFEFLQRQCEFKTLAIIYADNVSDIDLCELFQKHHETKTHFPMTVAIFRTENPSNCGIAVMDQDNVIIEFVEKPQTPTSDLANAGIIVVETEALRSVIGEEDVDFSRDVLPKFCGNMRGFVLNCYHRDYGTLEQLDRANTDLEEGRIAKLMSVE